MINKWEEALRQIDFAFQPIINLQTGITTAVEALLRNTEDTTFRSIDNFFNAAYNDGVLFSIDTILREKAISKFTKIPWNDHIKLFYNYDPRICTMPDYEIGATEKILHKYKLPTDKICFELNEKHKFDTDQLRKLVNITHRRGIRIAIDDFGTGFSGLELFYNSEPDYVKFDRFLVSGLDESSTKRSICKHLISLSKIFGATVIAEGIETEDELYFCMELGFDLVQGYYTGIPDKNIDNLEFINSRILELKNNFNYRCLRNNNLKKSVEKPTTIQTGERADLIIEIFKNNPECRAIPVTDSNNYPVGIIKDKDLKKYIYSPFGYNLLMNRSVETGINNFITHCPVADINSTDENIQEIFLKEYDCEGIIITWNMEYYGFLTRNEAINIINKNSVSPQKSLSKRPAV